MNTAVNLIGVFLIVFVCWFFFSKKKNEGVSAEGEVTILVQGGYKPDAIKIKKGKTITLKFDRKDESACLEEVVLPDFGVRQYLNLNEVTEVVITPDKSGAFVFSCGMNMFHGKIIVEE